MPEGVRGDDRGVMEERAYSNQNLAGILAEALGLESSSGRTDFSGTHRGALRRALDDPSAPTTFAELLAALESASANPETIAAVRPVARAEPDAWLQTWARDWVKGLRQPPRG